jgi:hypothetical protein
MNNHLDNSHGKSDQYENPLDKIKRLTGVQQEAHHNLVQGIIKDMKFKEDEVNDIARLHQEGIARVRSIRQYAHLIAQEHFDTGKELNKGTLLAEVNTKLLDNFCHYNKDQLLIMFCMQQTEIIMKDI